jgi:hypothetical protein
LFNGDICSQNGPKTNLTKNGKKMSLIFGVAMTTSPSGWHKQLHIMKAGCLLV